jgi:hypothetical protein
VTTTGENRVFVEFSVETADLFRASFDMVKFRLLLGLTFALMLISGLVLFFIMLGEESILLKTSPLFIALPLVAIGGQVLRLHALCRKYVSGLSSSQRRVRYLFSEGATGYDVTSGDSFSHISWTDVSKIVEKERYFAIFLDRFQPRIIPKRVLQRSSDLQALRAILSSSGRFHA